MEPQPKPEPALDSTSLDSLKASLFLDLRLFKPKPEPEATLTCPYPTCPYPKEHTEFFEYLGRYSPEPIWNRLSPFDRRGLLHRYEPRMDTYLRRGKRAEGFVPRNPFLWGIRIVGMEPKAFFWHLPKNIKKKLRRGSYKVSIRTKTTESTEPFSLEDVKVTLKEGSGSITFDWYRALGGRDHSKFTFVWGNPLFVDIWILIRRMPCKFDDSKFYKNIMFFIEEPLTNVGYSIPKHRRAIRDAEQEWRVIGRNYSLARPNVVTPEIVEKEFIPYLHVHFMYPFTEKVHKAWDSNYGDVQRIKHGALDYGESFRLEHNHFYRDYRSFYRDYRSLYNDYDQGFLQWYNQVLEGKMINQGDYYGFDMMPWLNSIWTNLQEFFNSKFKEMKVENWSECSASEVALLDETEIYSVFSESVRDMPSKLNRWCLVARKEPDPIKLVRCSELACQKAYSAFETKIEADKEILEILELYRQLFEEILAVPIIKGKASELEKLADGLYTATVEVFIPNGRWHANASGEFRRPYKENAWGIRGATAHSLGEKAMGWVNSWSCSIRAIGIMVMVHGDGRGLVLPPKVAPMQVIVIPGFKKSDIPGIHGACNCIVDALCEAGIRAKADLDINESKVMCKNYWLPDEFELISTYWVRKGVPLLIKVGSENDQLLALRRDNYEKFNFLRDSVSERVKEILDDIQTDLFEAAKSRQEACIRIVTSWDEFVEFFKFDSANIVLAPWCDDEEVEKNVKSRIDFERFGLEVKILCSPLEQPDIPEGTPCFFSGKPAKKWTYWGQSY